MAAIRSLAGATERPFPHKLYTSVCSAPPTRIRVPQNVPHNIASKMIGYAAVMA